MKRLLHFGALLAPLAAVAAHAAACDGGAHVYYGELYVATRDCLGTSSTLDVVPGEPASVSCPPLCLAQVEADGGRDIYVSTMCSPFPALFDASGNDYACPAALAALARGDTCFIDGGSAAPRDASPDADADASAGDAGDAG